MAPKLSAQDRKWQREDDARTLARAEEIKAIPTRMRNARKEARAMAKKSQSEAAALAKVANAGAVSRSNTKTPLSRSKSKKR